MQQCLFQKDAVLIRGRRDPSRDFVEKGAKPNEYTAHYLGIETRSIRFWKNLCVP
jgi:hypothetical protein